MYDSLWAPKAPNPPIATTANTTRSTLTSDPTSSPQNIRRLIDRLKWKSSLLQISHARAVTTSSTPSPPSHSSSPSFQPSAPAMFALDFYEYYTLLERILVLLLSFFAIRVPKETLLRSETASARDDHIFRFDGQRQQRMVYTHRFHANVLGALDKPGNPLHEVLGCQPVRRYLGVAKDFRNKWKDGGDLQDAQDGVRGRGEVQGDRVKREMLEGLDLEGMLEAIVGALERALNVVEVEGERRAGREGAEKSNGGLWNGEVTNGGVVGEEIGDCDMEDAPFEAVDDAMEWEGL